MNKISDERTWIWGTYPIEYEWLDITLVSAEITIDKRWNNLFTNKIWWDIFQFIIFKINTRSIRMNWRNTSNGRNLLFFFMKICLLAFLWFTFVFLVTKYGLNYWNQTVRHFHLFVIIHTILKTNLMKSNNFKWLEAAISWNTIVFFSGSYHHFYHWKFNFGFILCIQIGIYLTIWIASRLKEEYSWYTYSCNSYFNICFRYFSYNTTFRSRLRKVHRRNKFILFD